jgi:hypothetical protein
MHFYTDTSGGNVLSGFLYILHSLHTEYLYYFLVRISHEYERLSSFAHALNFKHSNSINNRINLHYTGG